MQQFTLEPVLNHRTLVEEKLQKELAVFKRALADEKEQLWALRKARTGFLGELKQKQEQSTTVSEIALYVGYIERLSRNLDQQREKISAVEEKVNQKREDLIEAMKKRKTIEKLKEKTLKACRQELSKKEENFLDEVGVSNSARLQRYENS
ncbi:MAG: flagellar export protein FliJ [Thermodesulfobacteriota bacterium]|nr:flagellar export protein FliJ [Thermodesulfobacteriota bacterium]